MLLRYDTEDVVRLLNDPLTADNQRPATTNILGKMKHAVQHQEGWTFTRNVQEALDSIEAVPLSSRYSFKAFDGGVAVEVLVREKTVATKQKITQSLEANDVPLTQLTLVENRHKLTNTLPQRCDMREYTIGLHEQAQGTIP